VAHLEEEDAIRDAAAEDGGLRERYRRMRIEPK
jgi:hypothetical protein